MVLLHVRRYDDAIAAAPESDEFPARPAARQECPGQRALHEGNLRRESWPWSGERWASDREVLEALERGYAEAGFAGARRRQCEVLAARYGRPGGVTAYTLAILNAQAGDGARVVEWLEKASTRAKATCRT